MVRPVSYTHLDVYKRQGMDSTVYPKTGNTLKGDVKHDSMRQRFIGSTERQRDKKQQGEGGSAAMWMVSKLSLIHI